MIAKQILINDKPTGRFGLYSEKTIKDINNNDVEIPLYEGNYSLEELAGSLKRIQDKIDAIKSI